MKFLRYPGGKNRLLSLLVDYLPKNRYIEGKYIEPFVGGGSVFLYVEPKSAIISDLNDELINLYKGIRDNPKQVWEIFESFPSGKTSYYKVRDDDFQEKSLYYRAARTLYLNRTCFKGMWRHNPKGNFNVGYGGEDRRWAITLKNLLDLSKRFKKAKIFQSDFEDILNNVSDGDFIFLDPPYKPGKKEMKEAHYINGRFTFEDQKRLAAQLKRISKVKKINWLMTNSNSIAIRKLYKDFNIVRITKGVSSVLGVLSNNSKEIIISNFTL